LAALNPPDCLLLIDAPELALGDKPPLATDRAEYAALRHLFAKTLQQLVLRLIGTQCHCSQLSHLLSRIDNLSNFTSETAWFRPLQQGLLNNTRLVSRDSRAQKSKPPMSIKTLYRYARSLLLFDR
jgi:hypothetical protein